MKQNIYRRLTLLCLILITLLLFGCSTEINVNSALDKSDTTQINNNDISGLGNKTAEAMGYENELKEDENSYFEISFIDVGQADSILISCDDHYALIDGGNVADSSLIYSYLKNKGINYLDYVVNTHPDEDHVGGLAGALNYATAGTVYATVTDWDTKAFSSFKKYVEEQGNSIIVPSVGDTFNVGSATAKVLAVNTDIPDSNDRSIVLMVTYGNNKFLLTGDAGDTVEQYLINNQDIEADLLKIAHHGSQYSTSYLFLRTVNPSICVISVGEGNSYGHPTEAVLSKIEDQGSTLYRTDLQGTVSCSSDGDNIACSVEKNPDINTYEPSTYSDKDSTTNDYTEIDTTSKTSESENSSENISTTYVLNTNTKKFHLPSCSSVNQMKDKNKEITEKSRDEIINEGYSPCKKCNP